MLKIAFRSMFILFLIGLLGACQQNNKNPPPLKAPAIFVAGKEYQVLSQNGFVDPSKPQQEVSVIEFFSYGCPACFQLESYVEKWAKQNPDYIKFVRVPVVFQPAWENYARIYYIAKFLGISEKINMDVFKALHVQGKNLNDPAVLQTFFISHGVTQEAYQSAASFLTGMESQLLRSTNLANQYQIDAAPTFIINGKYKVDPSMVNGKADRLFEVINYLVHKSQKGEN